METATVETPYDRYFKRVCELLTKEEVEDYMNMELQFNDEHNEVVNAYTIDLERGLCERKSSQELHEEARQKLFSSDPRSKEIYERMKAVGL